jgi:CO/xanthine dehydrogenase FAD-binding subunit
VTVSLTVAASVEEAVAELAAGARAVAGGTDLVVGARQGKASLPDRLVAIHQLADLRRIEVADETLRIGALVTHAEIVAHPAVRERLTALADASAIVGSHATRVHGTIGGNLMNASPAMETGGPLLCLSAVVVLRASAGERRLPVAELFRGPGLTAAAPGELLTRVEVPLPPADGAGSCYLRLEYRRQMEIAVVGATAALRFADGKVADARLAITALAPTIRRVPAAEEALVGTNGGREAAEEAAAAVAAASEPIGDVRASAAYRRAMAAVIARRAIEAAAARARGEGARIPANAGLEGRGG